MRKEFLRKFLSYFWLRPENAILLSIRAECYYNTLKYFGDGTKSMDVSCGDGVFSFLTFGGELDFSSDMFRSLDLSEPIRKGDYDPFDHYDDSYNLIVQSQPDHKYAIGTDWKESMIKKASALDFYSKLIHHDNNLELPLEKESLEYIYTNSSYWVHNFDAHIDDLVSKLVPGGHLVLEFKTSEIVNFTSPKYLPFMRDDFHEIIDAGRLQSWKGLKSYDELMQIMGQNDSIETVDIVPIYGDVLGQIWDIGLRPLFVPLSKMANNISPETRLEVKEEWCDIIERLFSSFIEGYEVNPDSCFEYLFVFKKKER